MGRTAWTVVAVAALAARAGAGDAPGLERLRELFAPGRPLNVQLAFDEDAMAHDLDMNTVSAGCALDDRGDLTVLTRPFRREGLEHCWRVRLREGRLAGLELLRRASAQEGWSGAPPELFLFVPAEPPRHTAEVDAEGRAILSLWGTCNRGSTQRGPDPARPGGKERGRALLVLRSGHVDGAGEARY